MKITSNIRRVLYLPHFKGALGWVYVCGAFCLSSCQNEWDEHYGRTGGLGDKHLMALISSDGRLSKFTKALRQTGVDALLTNDQTYTVWAPTDEALADLDFNDTASVQRIVSNHIARFSNPTSTEGLIKMLNGKRMQFSDLSTFNGAPIANADITARNGLLHILTSQIPYKYSIRELLDADKRFADVATFVSQFDQKIYDERRSTSYDSVFIDYNPLLEDGRYGIGDIADEDSLFTMILPSDDVWAAEMERVAPAFTAYAAAPFEADSIQHVQTGLAILGGLTFRGIVDETADSLVTVTGKVIKPVKAFLAGYERIEGSNGIIYVAPTHLNANDTCIWNHKLMVEAEDMDSRVALSGTNCYVRNTDVESLVQGVSDDSYLEVSSGNVDGGVTFYIADALATKYDVYVDFVNPMVDGFNLTGEKTKVVFQMMYRGSNGRSTAKNMSTPVEISGLTSDGEVLSEIISVKAFEGVEFPVSDYHDGMWHLQPGNASLDVTPTTTLQVRTRVTAADARNGYIRKFRVDCVRFVPVVE